MVYLGSDHAGFGIKKELAKFFITCCLKYEDCGPEAYDQTDDYPQHAEKVAKRVAANPGSRGILICGTGTGMVIIANKIKGIRAAVGFSDYAVKMARRDNDVNIITFSGRKQSASEIIQLVKIFLDTPFSDTPRHQNRLSEIKRIEGK